MDSNRRQKYPARSRRDSYIADLVGSSSLVGRVVAGRVMGVWDEAGGGVLGGVERGFILQDYSGRVVVEAVDLPIVGAIVEVEVLEKVGIGGEGQNFVIRGKWLELAACEDFYISTPSAPNYQKMLLNASLRDNLIKRGQIMAMIRQFFVERGFVEVDTPVLVRLPGMEPYLDVFQTRLEADFSADQKLSEEMYLITSPEYAMKKLLVGGLEKIFQITRSFRNKETFSQRHNPEFVMLEWYRAYASYLEIMDDTEALVKFLWKKFEGRSAQVDVLADWRRITVVEAFNEFAGVDEETFFDDVGLRSLAEQRGYGVFDKLTWEDAFFAIFMNEIEGRLGFGQPMILYDYPVSMAALSKRCERDGRLAERFEVYIAGLEICNAFSELNDPVEQERRLSLEREERASMGKPLYDVDKSFVEALRMGLPPSGGNALGVDRLIMLLCGDQDINNVLFFPYKDL